MSINLKNPSYYANQSGSLVNIIITGVSTIIALACAVQIYFIFNHERDYLAGAIGLIHSDSSGISLLKFYLTTGAIAFSIASHKYLKLVAAGLAIYVLVGMYGTQFFLKSQQNFSVDTLPKVTDAPLNSAQNTLNDIDDTNPEAVEAFATNRGYIKTNNALDVPSQGWCRDHKNQSELARINCYTGYIWRKS